MITLVNLNNGGKEPNLFYAKQEDIGAGLHFPNDEGIMEETGVKLRNGDTILVMDEGIVLFYSKPDKTWIEL